MNILKGSPSAHRYKLAIVISRFNEEVTEGLLHGAVKYLREEGYSEDELTIVEVPGAFEIPLAAESLASLKKFDAIITLGAVIRGETAHFEYISKSVQEGILQTSLKHGIPVSFGVITTYNEEQAFARSGDNAENKGKEAAAAAIEMTALLKKLKL